MKNYSPSLGAVRLRATALATAAFVCAPLVYAQPLNAQPSQAQPASPDVTVVTATRFPVRVNELVSDVVRIEADKIAQYAGQSLVDVLQQEAGLQVVQSGGLGSGKTVFIRGTESRHVLLLINGVRYGSATAGIPVWETIPLSSIARIEVLKGPASSLYGSDAVGGVVQIFTHDMDNADATGLAMQAAVTAGSASHRHVQTSVQGGNAQLRYRVGVQRTQEDSISATRAGAPFGVYEADKDAFEQNAVEAAVQAQLAEGWTLETSLLHSDGNADYDDGEGVDANVDIASTATQMAITGRINPQWQTSLHLGQSKDTSEAVRSAFLPSRFITKQQQLSWLHRVQTPVGVVQTGLERQTQKVQSSVAYDVNKRDIDSAFVGLQGATGSHSWQINARHDRNSQFDSAQTGFVGYGYELMPGLRAHAAYGTSFVAPSFNQLYYPQFGNPNLQPEEGKNLDLGLRFETGAHQFQLTRFDNRITGFISNETVASNIPKAKIQGWSLNYQSRASMGDGRLRWHAALDRLDAANEQTGLQLPRRAQTQATAGVGYVWDAWDVGTQITHVGKRFDDVKNTQELAAYTKLDMTVGYQWTPAWRLQLRLNNLTDRQFETAYGYNQMGRSAYLTLRFDGDVLKP